LQKVRSPRKPQVGPVDLIDQSGQNNIAAILQANEGGFQQNDSTGFNRKDMINNGSPDAVVQKSPYRFEVGLSFAGDNKRDKIREVADQLRNRLGEDKVFFDEYYESEIAGHDADTYLQNIYLKQVRLVVSCVCKRYDEKPWTQDEWRAIRAFERTCRTPETRPRFLPLRFGDGDVDGIFENAIVPDVRNRDAESIANLIEQRLDLIRPATLKLPPKPPKPNRAPRAIFVLPCLLAVVLLIVLYAAFGPESDFQGEVSVYGFPVTSGEITLREKGRSRPVEKTSINESGRFILRKTREVASAQLDFQLDEPAEIISPDQALKEKTNLHPVIPWEEIKRAFRDGKGKELVERAKTLGYSLEIEATYRKLTDKNIGSRFFLMSESEIVRDAESGSNGGAQVLLIDCDVETIPNPALAGPLRIRGIPASYSDLSASKELFLKHCIIVVNGQPYGN
jgi:hypothetical protein